MLETILKMLKDMRLLVIRSGIPEKRYDKLVEVAESQTDNYGLQLLHDDLESVYEQEWPEAKKIWEYISPEAWDMYNKMGIEGQTEQDLLVDALYQLKEPMKEIVKSWRLKKRSRKSAFSKSSPKSKTS